MTITDNDVLTPTNTRPPVQPATASIPAGTRVRVAANPTMTNGRVFGGRGWPEETVATVRHDGPDADGDIMVDRADGVANWVSWRHVTVIDDEAEAPREFRVGDRVRVRPRSTQHFWDREVEGVIEERVMDGLFMVRSETPTTDDRYTQSILTADLTLVTEESQTSDSSEPRQFQEGDRVRVTPAGYHNWREPVEGVLERTRTFSGDLYWTVRRTPEPSTGLPTQNVRPEHLALITEEESQTSDTSEPEQHEFQVGDRVRVRPGDGHYWNVEVEGVIESGGGNVFLVRSDTLTTNGSYEQYVFVDQMTLLPAEAETPAETPTEEPEVDDSDKVAVLRTAIAEMNERWERLNSTLNDKAREQQWCGEYEQVIEPLGFEGRPQRKCWNVDVDVTFTRTVQHSTSSSDLDSAVTEELGSDVELEDFTIEVTATRTVTVHVCDKTDEDDATGDVDESMVGDALRGAGISYDDITDFDATGAEEE